MSLHERRSLSARGYYRVLKLARPTADLADSEAVCASHLAEALPYRAREREEAKGGQHAITYR